MLRQKKRETVYTLIIINNCNSLKTLNEFKTLKWETGKYEKCNT